MRTQYIHELKALPQNMRVCLSTVNDFSLKMAQELKKYHHIMFLGEGLGEAVAAEGALKMKELTYLHCHTFSLREIANSFYSYAKMNEGTPAIFVVLDSNIEEKRLVLMQMHKLKSAGIKLFSIVITDCQDAET